MRRNTTQTAIAGEYYVLAELARRDAICAHRHPRAAATGRRIGVQTLDMRRTSAMMVSY
jgi:hypothetical protein